MNKLSHLLSLLFTLWMFVATSCSHQQGTVSLPAEQPLTLTDASLLRIYQGNQYEHVVIQNPWDTTLTLASYVLLPDSVQTIPQNLPQATLLRTPLKRAAIGSVVHLNLWYAFGSRSVVKAVCDAQYITDSLCLQALKKGTVINLGTLPQINTEKLLQSQCDALLLSSLKGTNYNAIHQAGVPVVECVDYMETSPLGRAEWMRFYGRLMGKGAMADSIFFSIKQKYTQLKQRAIHAQHQPSVFMDVMYGGIWYQPGGNSTLGRLLHDAGSNYVFANNASNGSLQLSFEQVLGRAQNANVWLVRHMNPEPLSYASLCNLQPNCHLFSAWKNHRVYACNTQETQFFEQTPFHPELLLENLIHVFHPEVVTHPTASYFTPLP